MRAYTQCIIFLYLSTYCLLHFWLQLEIQKCSFWSKSCEILAIPAVLIIQWKRGRRDPRRGRVQPQEQDVHHPPPRRSRPLPDLRRGEAEDDRFLDGALQEGRAW